MAETRREREQAKNFDWRTQNDSFFAGGARIFSRKSLPFDITPENYWHFLCNVPLFEDTPPYVPADDPYLESDRALRVRSRSYGFVAVVGAEAFTNMSTLIPDGTSVPGIDQSPREVRYETTRHLAKLIDQGEAIHILPSDHGDQRMLRNDMFSIGRGADGVERVMQPAMGGDVYFEDPGKLAIANAKMDHALRLSMPTDEALEFLKAELRTYMG